MSTAETSAIHHLAESINEFVHTLKTESPDGNVLQGYRLRPAPERLLYALIHAPNHFLSKEDIRQDVLYDDDASDDAVRSCVRHARQDLAQTPLPYRITTIRAKGYQLLQRD